MEPDLIFSSRTQTPEQVQSALTNSGYDDVKLDVLTDAPKEEPKPEPTETPVDQTTVAKTEGGDPEPSQKPPVVAEDSKPRRPGSWERKAKKATAEADALRETLAKEKEARERLEAEVKRPSAVKQETTAPVLAIVPDAKAKPKRADFIESDDPDESYLDALQDWKDSERDRKSAQSKVDEQRVATEDANRRHTEWWNGRLGEAKSNHSDFDEVLNAAGDGTWNAVMQHAVQGSDVGAEALYWLGKNPEEARRIFKATNLPANATHAEIVKASRLMYRELEKIEAQLQTVESDEPEDDVDEDEEAPAAPPVVQPPAAPAPVTPPPAAPVVVPPKKFTPVSPVGNRGGKAQKAVDEMSKDELAPMSIDEYRKLRNMR